MKILHALGWYLPDSLGGTELYVKALAERQRTTGHDVRVAAPRAGAVDAESVEVDGVSVLRYPVPPVPSRDEARSLRAARGSEHLRDALTSFRPDVFHVHTLTTGLGIHEIEHAREHDIRVVVTNHLASTGFLCQRGTLMRWGERPCDGAVFPFKCGACALEARGLPKPVALTVAGLGVATKDALSHLPGALGTALGMPGVIRTNQELQDRLIDTVDRFVLLNEQARDIVVRNGGAREKLALNYLGVAHTRYQKKPSVDVAPTKRPVTIGYLGRLAVIKGVLELVRAVRSLPLDLELRLELRGPMNDGDAPRLKRRIEDVCRGDVRIVFAPAVPPQDVPNVLASYDVLCVPSICFEGGPTVVSEAHAVGTPVIGTRIGAMPELLEDGRTGALVTPGDWRELADVIARVATTPEKTIDRWRRALPEPRTMDDVAIDYEALYADIVA